MKSNILKYTLSFGFFAFLIACSVKKDKFINRNFHAVTTEYNVLYNGNLALDKGLVDLKATYQDNFWEMLPIERMPDNEEAILPGQTKNANFERAEEKAVKAIQKHSMNIGGTEKNPQMDEAYLLLAKARYYDNRFIPSLEALNYILYKHPSSDKIYHAKVWREKVNIRLDNDEVAIKNLKKLLENKNVSGQDLADANAMLTQAYMNIEAQDSAVATLKIAKQTTKINEEKARYAFILGQLYENLNHQDSAFASFEEVIQMNRKSPRRYVIQAHAKQAQQFDFTKGDTLAFVKKFNNLLDDRENRPYLDVLNHQIGLFYDKQEKNALAEHYYNKSLKAVSRDNYLVASNYRNIGEIKFKEAKYITAGKYYDSTLIRLNDRTREFRLIKKKRTNLVDVIKYETIATQNDSILSVVAMNDSQRNTYYENYISKLKIEDERKAKLAAEIAKKEANILANQSSGSMNLNNPNSVDNSLQKSQISDVPRTRNTSIMPPGNVIGSDDVNNFYFYNPVTVEFGKKEFISKWGKRELKDNWRWSSLKSGITSIDMEIDENTDDLAVDNQKEAITVNPLYEVNYYLKQIPTDDKLLDSLAKDRNFAYYQLGIIYKEKFKEYELAASRLEQLLKNNPEERLILPAKYNLFKIYQIISPAKAEIMKQQILNEFPNSRYAEIVKNPSVAIADDTNPEAVYYATFKRFENNQVREVAQEIDELINRFTGEESVAKFEMLKARIAARLQGLEEYKKALNFVALSYPNIDEGKEAEKLLKNDIPKLEALDFNKEEASEWKIIFPKKFPLDKDVKNLTDKIEKYFKDSNTVLLKSSDDIYDMNNNFIVIHGFSSRERANSVLSLLKEYKDYKIKDQAYIISTEDYKIVQMKKKFEEWLLLNQ